MIFSDPIIDYVIILTAFLTISFALGIYFGFTISLWGDVIAVLLVGLGSILIQAFLLPEEIGIWNWIVFSVIGTIIGIILSFILILVIVKHGLVALDLSHVVTFPVILLGLVVSQYLLLINTYNSSLALSWLIYSLLGFSIGLIILGILSNWISFNIDILEEREADYSAIIKWAIIGFILGLSYSISSAQILKHII